MSADLRSWLAAGRDPRDQLSHLGQQTYGQRMDEAVARPQGALGRKLSSFLLSLFLRRV